MFDRFTDRAKKVMSLSREEALQLKHDDIGPEHILLGITSEGTGVAANVLMNRQLTLTAIRETTCNHLTEGPGNNTMSLPFTPPAKAVLESALDEAAKIGHNYIGTEHLLLGLLRVDESIAARSLRELGIELDQAREDVVEFCGGPSESVEPTSEFLDAAALRRAALKAMLRRGQQE